MIYTFAAMPHTPIQKVTIQNCGCVKNAEVNLTRLHALIGPNDSGKSTILRALHTATQFATGEFTKNDKGEILPFTPMVSESTDGAVVGLALGVGETGTEPIGKAKAQRLLADQGITTTAKMVGEAMANRPVPEDAIHLRSWLVQAKAALV